MMKMQLRMYLPSAPVWMCGFRSFFLASAGMAVALLGWWVLFLLTGGALPVPQVPGGPFIWHAHELIFGFALAALAGFALTAFPEFTDTPSIAPCTVRRLFGLWLLGRLGFWLSGLLGAPALALSGAAHLALLGGLLYLLAPRLFAAPDRRHISFAWALLARSHAHTWWRQLLVAAALFAVTPLLAALHSSAGLFGALHVPEVGAPPSLGPTAEVIGVDVALWFFAALFAGCAWWLRGVARRGAP